jgi:hypothetical protein
MCDMDSIPLAEHYWHAAYRAFLGRVPSRGAIVNRSNEAVATQVPLY